MDQSHISRKPMDQSNQNDYSEFESYLNPQLTFGDKVEEEEQEEIIQQKPKRHVQNQREKEIQRVNQQCPDEDY